MRIMQIKKLQSPRRDTVEGSVGLDFVAWSPNAMAELLKVVTSGIMTSLPSLSGREYLAN